MAQLEKMAENTAVLTAAETRPAKQGYPLRVAYDAQAFLSANGGTGKGIYLRNLIAPHAQEFFGLATPGRSYFEYPLVQAGFSRYHLWHQASVPGLLRKLKADVFLAPYNTAPLFLPKRTKLVLVLHDLILLERFPTASLKQRLDNEYRRFLIPRAVAKAHAVITVSAYVQREIEQRFPGARVHMIPNTIDRSWFVTAPTAHHDRGNYILMVTSSAPHKNSERAFEAYAAFVKKLPEASRPRLRTVGLGRSPETYLALARSLQIADLLDFEAFVPESGLQELYRRAQAVLIPSLREGFGIPVLEGMASGTPVLTSDKTSLPEVGGAAAVYFDPLNVGAMTRALEEVLTNPAKQQAMMQTGLVQAQQYHPGAVGRTISAFWDRLAH